MEFLLVDHHPVYTEGLRAILQQIRPGCRIQSVASCAECVSLLRAKQAAVDLVLLDMNLADRPEISALRAVFEVCPKQRVAVLSGVEDPVLAQSAFREGAAGFIPRSLPADAMARAISVILDGGTYAPPLAGKAGRLDVADNRDKSEEIGERTRELLLARGLTARDLDIVELLVRGKSNKHIAGALGLSEWTVKVHITRILKQLNARNRTEAAFVVRQLG